MPKKLRISKARKEVSAQVRGAKKAVKAISNAISSIQKSRALKSKRTYSVRDLPIKSKGTFAERLKEIEKNSDKIDKLKKPNEFWAAKLWGAKTYQVYTNIDLLINTLNRYEAIQQNGNKKGKKLNQLIEGIKFVKFDGTPRKWVKGKEAEVNERESKQKKLKKEVTEVKKKHRKVTKVVKQKQQRIRKLEQELKAMRKKLKAAQKSNVVKKIKRSTKKVVKKIAAKPKKQAKTVVKKQTRKVAKKKSNKGKISPRSAW